MSGFRNVYTRGDLVFVGRYHATREGANEAMADELCRERATSLFAIATDTSGPTWEDELRGLGRIVGITDSDASAEVIGDALTSERDTLRNALRNISLGATIPPPDPVAHSWQAYAGFWQATVEKMRANARLALSRTPTGSVAEP